MKRSQICIFALLVVSTISFIELCIYNNNERFNTNFNGKREDIWAGRIRDIEKIDSKFDIVFLGDSTLVAAIDDKIFTRESGLKSINLALTGDLITYGDYAILNRYIAKNGAPKAIVLWHTIDVWQRNLDPQLFAFTQPYVSDSFCYISYLMKLHSDGLMKSIITIPSVLIDIFLMRIPSYRSKYSIRDYFHLWIAESKISFSENISKTFSTGELIQENVELKRNQERNLQKSIEWVSQMNFFISPESRLWFEKLIDITKKYNIKLLVARSPIHIAIAHNEKSKKSLNFINTTLTDPDFNREVQFIRKIMV